FVTVLTVQSIAPASIPLRYRPRLSVVDWTDYNHHEPAGPGTYAFGYDIEDPATNNIQFRNEERHPNGTVTGSYGYVEPDGNVRIVHYVADHNGYRYGWPLEELPV
ncbi:Chitin bind 4 domain containing protein, partial [Asbolus verrucosus]